MGNSNIANSLFTKINEILIPGLLFATTFYTSWSRKKTGQVGKYFKEWSHKGNVKKSRKCVRKSGKLKSEGKRRICG